MSDEASDNSDKVTQKVAMDDDEGVEILLLGYILCDDDLWRADMRPRDNDDAVELPKKRRWWVRPWIGKRDTEENNTMYKLQLEISEVRGAHKMSQ